MPPTIKVKHFSRSRVSNIVPPQVVHEALPDPIPAETEPAELEANNDMPEMDTFLSDLTNDNFIPTEDLERNDKERIKREKEWEKEQNKMIRQKKLEEAEQKKAAKAQKDLEKEASKRSQLQVKYDDDALFSEKGSQLYGRDKLELLAKIQQYKVLFPDNKQLKQLKVKQTASVDELQKYLSECEAIVDCDCVETFITDSILQVCKLGEFASVHTKYNIKGLSDMLRQNPQFNLLCKQLYIKYKVFSKVPPEAQMAFLVVSTAYVCIEKNKQDERKQALLNKPIDIEQL
jgi:hypothetical protein